VNPYSDFYRLDTEDISSWWLTLDQGWKLVSSDSNEKNSSESATLCTSTAADDGTVSKSATALAKNRSRTDPTKLCGTHLSLKYG